MFGPPQGGQPFLRRRIGSIIPEEDTVKYLGLHLDSQPSWKTTRNKSSPKSTRESGTPILSSLRLASVPAR
ncbi:hypothetical protein RvY_00164 [Ramazzottius varieornatus]|uniref:Uncharacterized protein n=1 Tax=Ramazzottius varieornatus TaxID=947166 RepID=A0A1D1UFY2_RAMVA|nr:hypothetical protein RvY_00164 [Ramazzottius varieornatus]